MALSLLRRTCDGPKGRYWGAGMVTQNHVPCVQHSIPATCPPKCTKASGFLLLSSALNRGSNGVISQYGSHWRVQYPVTKAKPKEILYLPPTRYLPMIHNYFCLVLTPGHPLILNWARKKTPSNMNLSRNGKRTMTPATSHLYQFLYQICLNILCNKPNNEKSSWFHFNCNELKVILQEEKKKATQVSSQSIIFPDLCTALPS